MALTEAKRDVLLIVSGTALPVVGFTMAILQFFVELPILLKYYSYFIAFSMLVGFPVALFKFKKYTTDNNIYNLFFFGSIAIISLWGGFYLQAELFSPAYFSDSVLTVGAIIIIALYLRNMVQLLRRIPVTPA